MKPLDKLNTPAVWNIGAIVAILGIIGTILSNPIVLANLVTLFTGSNVAAKIAAVSVILGIIAAAIGKPLGTSSREPIPPSA